ncbi:toll-like receptor 1 [Kryptolebias marmoratus]|uniref:Toll-like receptor 1 n=1 Tax=Kryptolebias marmoratus TaxID=37003 RepID=A0A3Q3A9F8_KRYMA|nr:toll-like receptor 1 [Kryptolebias marmoratus]
MRLPSLVFWAAVVSAGLKMCASSPDSIVDRSSKNLSSVPTDLPQTAESLDLSCNRIHRLHRGDFKNVPLLRALNVSWNGLELIDADAFLDTPRLNRLDLSHNRLMNLSAQQYLLHTGSLVVLSLAWNKFLNMTLGVEFSFLKELENLTLGAKDIRVGDFRNLAELKLQSLTLSLEEEQDYEAGSLMDVHAQSLHILFNKGEIILSHLIADALSLFVDVELKNLTGGYNILTTQLGEVAEIHTARLFLNNIQIDWKDLTECVNAALRTSISHMSSSDAAITKPPFLDTKETETSNMTSFTVREGVVKSFFFVQETMYNFFINLPVKHLTITETSIIHMTCPKKQSPILELDFSYCAMSDSIFSREESQTVVECETLSNLTKLTLRGNNLKNLQLLSKRLKYMISLQQLDISVNFFVYDGSTECLWPQNITVLNISSGGLTDSVFNCLPTGVVILDLQDNQISVVPATILKLKNLASLNLNANRLRDLPTCDNFPGLIEILLKSNSLHSPSLSKMESCPGLKLLDASHNPFTCTCTLRDFISFGIEAENNVGPTGIKLLSWPHGYNCFYPEDVRDSMLKGFWISEVSCNARVLAATILVPAVVLISTVFFLCQHYDVPWYTGMIWRWTRAKHRARRRQVRPEDLIGVEFHAFVSYSQHDADWVKNHLILNLEGPAGGLTICHHERNFVPGKTIVENIISCVEKSRRSVFVLSANFVKSEWCHYELYFASHQRLAMGLDNIVLVLLEPLPQYLIPSKYHQLKAMMNRHTYLEWPQDRGKHRLFWANLRAALQADLPDAADTQTLE